MYREWSVSAAFRRIWVVFFMAVPLAAQVDVLTRHNNIGRTGSNLNESQLKPSNVNNQHFGKLAYRLVDGNVYAQPLVVSQAKIDGHAATNAVIVATEHNSVYAFDGDDTNQASTTAQLWHTGPDTLGIPVDSLELYTKIGAPTCTDLTTEIGTTATPAIVITKGASPKEGAVFVVSKSNAGGVYVYKLFSLNLANGKKLSELLIQGEVKGSGIGAAGSGANETIRFNPRYQLNRPALLLDGNKLYVAFGGHCDKGPYHGWLFVFDVSNPDRPKQLDVFCTSPNGKGSIKEGLAGIWMSGEGLSADDQGNVYFATANGTYNGTTDFGDTVVKAKVLGGKIQVQDWYTPKNQDFLKANDVDLGSGGVVVVPNSHLLIAGGKEGRLFLIDRDQMGQGQNLALQSFQVTHDPDLRFQDAFIFYNIHGSAIIWPRPNEMFVYMNGEENPIKQYRLIPDTTPGAAGWKFDAALPFKSSENCPTKPNCVASPYPNFPTGLFGQARDEVWMPGGSMSLSANGDADDSGILWITMPYASNANHAVVRGVLRALDASDVSKAELWDSENTGNTNDRLGQFAKFCPPTIANGKVYVGTFQQETIGHDGVHRPSLGGDQPALAIYGLKN